MINSPTLTRSQQISAAVITLAVAVALPYLIHLLPPIAGAPAGARLLPIFVAPLLAVLFLRPQIGIAAALFAPLLNHLLIGMPTQNVMIVLTIELVAFTGILSALHIRLPQAWLGAPLAYFGAKLVAFFFLLVTEHMPTAYVANSIETALPGIIILTVLHFAVINWQAQRHD